MAYQELETYTPNPVLSWAGHDLGHKEMQMARNVASLPFVYKHVALMPDVHLGKGALVGSVIATKDAVIPAAVGVDIGCFVGTTRVPLVDGKSYTLEELARQDRELIVYACTPAGKIVAAKAIAKLTRKNAALIKVTLDHGEVIICTPDHQFMLRDGNYQECQYLNVGTSLMPFYSRVDRDGYTLVSQPYSGKWQTAQSIVARSGMLGEIPGFKEQKTAIHNDDREYEYEYQYNHKVLAIEPLDYTQDVYCLSVPGFNNFALSAGVFVHNCGMMAVKTPFDGDRLEGKLKKIRLDIESKIPVGYGENKDISKEANNWAGWKQFKELHKGVKDLDGKAMRQMGSLGGGNHFIEVCIDTENQVWLMLHSGSRNIGNKLAQCHIDTAKDLAKMADIGLPDRDLAYFVSGTPEFAAYWQDLQWAQNYAKVNRDIMMARFMRVIEHHLDGGKRMKPLLSVNCHHNYAEKEEHFGESVYVTRKGAVRAQAEDYGIIPGSMGTKSYIVKGKGNAHSFCSCSHGAGRIMSRAMAKNTFSLDDLLAQTSGVECRKDTGIIDEIPGAYKSIDRVMENQADLVEVVATLKQVVCVKG
jgi:tRNA-splicing ligase RtcB (3'-phosphate/5'-hydroxy nucleic acid ligase)